MKKAQLSIEFITGVTILIFIYAVAIGIFSHYIQTPLITNEIGKQVCYRVSRAIDVAGIGGGGFSTNASIPESVKGNYYFVIVSNASLVTVDWGDAITSCSLTTQNVTYNIFYPCTFSTTKINDTVIVSAVSTNQSSYNLGETINIFGSYYISNVTLDIHNETGSIFKINLTTTNGYFEKDWTPSAKGEYTIYAKDVTYKTLNSKKEINII